MGERNNSWYSKDFGAWHIIFLNINNNQCQIVACNVGSAQYNWFKTDLEKNAANGDRPTIVIMHYTFWRVSSTTGRDLIRPYADLMYQYGTEILIEHDTHNFQAFNPMKPDSTLDPNYGIRTFLTGFGGAPLSPVPTVVMPKDRIAHTNFTDFGVLELTLNPTNYSWKVHTTKNTDSWSGSGSIHGKPGSPVVTSTPVSTATPLPQNSMALTPVEDSYVSNETSAIAATNFGSSTILYSDANPVKQSFLKYNLAPLNGKTITSAKLKFKTANLPDGGSPFQHSIKIVENTTWSENQINFNNKPQMSTTVVGTVMANTLSNTEYEIELNKTSLQSNVGNLIALGIDTSGNDGLYINSRETGTPPTLFITYDGTSTPTPACSIPPENLGTATLNTTLSTSGQYRIWTRMMSGGPQANSYWLQIDGNCPINIGDSDSMKQGSWEWIDYSGGNNNNKVNAQLSSGNHTFKLIGRESGAKIDVLLLSSDLNCVPTGLGDNCKGITPTPAMCEKKTQGDANCDNSIDLIDFEQFRTEFIKFRQNELDITQALADFNSDKSIDLADFELFRQGFINQRTST